METYGWHDVPDAEIVWAGKCAICPSKTPAGPPDRIVAKDTQPHQVAPGLLQGHEVAVHVRHDPEPVDIEVGHDDGQPRPQVAAGFEDRSDRRRQEVGAHDPVRFRRLQEADERPG